MNALQALTDKLDTALNALPNASADEAVSNAEAIRDLVLCASRIPNPADLGNRAQWQRAQRHLDLFEKGLVVRLSQVERGLRALGREQPIYDVPGHNASR